MATQSFSLYKFKNPTLILGLVLALIVIVNILIGPLISPYDPTKMDFASVLAAPSWHHLFGTDSYGRDVLTRVFYGARVSFSISIIGVLLSALCGISLGMISAYHGRSADMSLMRFVDLVASFPSFVLALLLIFVFQPGIPSLILAIALVFLPTFARVSRNMTLEIKSEPFVEAARLMGQSTARILIVEILPNIAAAMVVLITTEAAFAVILEAGLSFLGLGIQPPTPTLGGIMSDGKDYFHRAPWVLTLSGLSACIALVALNLIGDGIRDLMDPRLRKAIEK